MDNEFEKEESSTKKADCESCAFAEVSQDWSKGAGTAKSSEKDLSGMVAEGHIGELKIVDEKKGADTEKDAKADGKAADKNEKAAEKGADAPELGSFARIEHMIGNGQMIQNGQFTPQALEAISAYIQNGPWNAGALNPFGSAADTRAGYVQELLNRTYATPTVTETLSGTVVTPPMYAPFTVSQTPGRWQNNGNQLGATYIQPTLTITQPGPFGRPAVVGNR